MAYLNILNGSFDNDPSAEKIRESFEKSKTMFQEIFDKIPLELTNGQSGYILVVNAAGTGFDVVALSGGGDMLAINNLSDLTSPPDARANLGLGSLALGNASDFATSAQGAKADTAVQSVGVAAGSGLSVGGTALNPILNISGGVDGIYVSNIIFDPATGVLSLEREGDIDLTIDMSQYLVLTIDGFQVTKGIGTNLTSIEVGDKCRGWDGNNDVAFVVNALPHTIESNRDYATNNSI